MKVSIVAESCIKCGLCTDEAPDLFVMGEDSAEVVESVVPPRLETAVSALRDSCPSDAIRAE